MRNKRLFYLLYFTSMYIRVCMCECIFRKITNTVQRQTRPKGRLIGHGSRDWKWITERKSLASSLANALNSLYI